MRYFHTVTVDEIVHSNLASFLKGKKKGAGNEMGDELFDRITVQIIEKMLIQASTLNDYLRGLMEGLTAKVFRTYNASVTL